MTGLKQIRRGPPYCLSQYAYSESDYVKRIHRVLLGSALCERSDLEVGRISAGLGWRQTAALLKVSRFTPEGRSEGGHALLFTPIRVFRNGLREMHTASSSVLARTGPRAPFGLVDLDRGVDLLSPK